MSSESQRHSWTGTNRHSRSGLPSVNIFMRTVGAVRRQGLAVLEKYRIAAYVLLSALIGLGFGQLVVWLAAHETLSTYIAFIPGNMEIAGVPHERIRMVTTRAVVEGLHQLLQDYESLCREHPLEAVAGKVDCERVHKMSREPIPEN
jgi:hypothetical protein